MTSISEIKKILNQKKGYFLKKYGLKIIGIFGSYIRNEQTENSDLDILVALDEQSGIDLLKFIEIENELSDLIGIRVDLVLKKNLKPLIGKRIMKEYQPV